MVQLLYADVSCLNNDTLFDACYRTLPQWRKEKTDRLYFRRDKNLSLAAGTLLSIAAKKCESDSTNCEIAFGKKGKPYFVEADDVHFSLSHSGSLAVCAVSDMEIGVDIEQICDFKKEIARRYFSAGECRRIFALQNIEEQKKLFFRLWVLRESFVKTTGEGIGAFSDFEIDLKSTPCIKRNGQCSFYSFREFDFPGYQCAVCTAKETEKIALQKVNLIQRVLSI